MEFSKKLVLVVCALMLAVTKAGSQQPSIVPAAHGVYDWLWTQRVWGRLPKYEMEVRPMSRDVILGHLRTLASDSAAMSQADRGLLRDFLNEFDFTRLLANGALKALDTKRLPGTALAALRTRKDPYLYAALAPDSSFSGAASWSVGIGNAYDNVVGDQSYYLRHRSFAGRAFVNSRMGLGASVEVGKYATIGGSTLRLLGLDPKLERDWLFFDSIAAVDAYHSEAWVSFARGFVNVDYGTGAGNYGPAVTDALVLRADAPDITQLRARVGANTLRYTFVHGALPSAPLVAKDTFTTHDGRNLVTHRRVPRWVAMHRVAWNPTPRWSASLHDMIVYGGRGADPRWLVPVLPFFEPVHAADPGNSDNGLFGADVVFRPRAGSEVFASILLDHVDIGSLKDLFNFGSSETHLKRAQSFGLVQRLPFDVRLGLGYLRADQFMYTHHTLVSTWEVDGRSLGAANAPNSDEIAIRLTRWFPLRTRVMVGARRIRKGLNPVDSTGAVTQNVGGDLLAQTTNWSAFLKGADIHTMNRFEFDLESEPLRGLKLTWKRSAVDVLQGTRIPSHTGTMFFRITYGF